MASFGYHPDDQSGKPNNDEGELKRKDRKKSKKRLCSDFEEEEEEYGSSKKAWIVSKNAAKI